MVVGGCFEGGLGRWYVGMRAGFGRLGGWNVMGGGRYRDCELWGFVVVSMHVVRNRVLT